MASGPITSWEIDGETMETVRNFILWGSKITADGDCSDEIKRCLLLERKVVTNLDSVLKSRHIILPTKVCIAKAMVFPVVMYGCPRQTIKKAECQTIDAFEGWCWRRLLSVPWPARRSNLFILKEISPGCSLEGLMDYLPHITCLIKKSNLKFDFWSGSGMGKREEIKMYRESAIPWACVFDISWALFGTVLIYASKVGIITSSGGGTN